VAKKNTRKKKQKDQDVYGQDKELLNAFDEGSDNDDNLGKKGGK